MSRGLNGFTYLCLLLLPLAGNAAQPQRHDTLFVQTSVYTVHFNPDPDHVNRQNLLGIEYDHAGGWLLGGAFFENSFGQPTQYLYVGKKFVLSKLTRHLYGKLTGGLVHGYEGEHQHAIPFNGYGVAPVILPSLGLQFGGFATELVVFGAAGVMLNVGWNFRLGGKRTE